MDQIKNYIGQLRLYSLADLILLLVVLQTNTYQLVGVVILHIAFLVYLESNHAHEYRAKVPKWLAYVLAIIGAVLFRKIEGLFYLVFSYVYTKKNRHLGFVSPLARGLQNFFIVASIIGYASPFSYFVGALYFIRNVLGDFRDIAKDKKNGMKTIPILFGLNRSIPHIHLIGVIITSVAWWSYDTLSIWWLVFVIIVEISTYKLTPR